MSHGKERAGAGSRQLHKDWRVRLVVILMLLAMLMYVISRDDSVVPGF